MGDPSPSTNPIAARYQRLRVAFARFLIRVLRAAMEDDVRDLRTRAIFGAIAQLRVRAETVLDGGVVDLRTSELKVFSQNGEDGIIETLVRTLGVETTFFVEFGVEDGSECNARLLAEVFGWNGLFIEPHGPSYARLAARHRGNPGVRCLNDSVRPNNINALFDAGGVPSSFGVLSIDVDGQEYWLWHALEARYAPAIVVIECNTQYAPDSRETEVPGIPWSREFRHPMAASVGALAALGRDKGYRLVHVELCGVNAFFVHEDLLRRAGHDVIGVLTRSPNYDMKGIGHPTGSSRPVTEVAASPPA